MGKGEKQQVLGLIIQYQDAFSQTFTKGSMKLLDNTWDIYVLVTSHISWIYKIIVQVQVFAENW